MSKVAVVDYGMGNLHSVSKALEFVGAVPHILREPADPDQFERVVLPGVGALGDCMEGLQSRKLDEWIKAWIHEDRPFLGVCLGLQALFEYSEEFDTSGLGILEGKVRHFQLEHEFKVPHMGWNSVDFEKTGTAMDELVTDKNYQFYFDHSFYVKPEDERTVWGKNRARTFVCKCGTQGKLFRNTVPPGKKSGNRFANLQKFSDNVMGLDPFYTYPTNKRFSGYNYGQNSNYYHWR